MERALLHEREDILGGVCELLDASEADAPRGALDGVDDAEDVAHRLLASFVLLEGQQFLVESREAFGALEDEVLDQLAPIRLIVAASSTVRIVAAISCTRVERSLCRTESLHSMPSVSDSAPGKLSYSQTSASWLAASTGAPIANNSGMSMDGAGVSAKSSSLPLRSVRRGPACMWRRVASWMRRSDAIV